MKSLHIISLFMLMMGTSYPLLALDHRDLALEDAQGQNVIDEDEQIPDGDLE